jgi:hypothetical protein
MNLKTNSNIKHIRYLYRGISDYKKGYQPRTNIVRDDKGDLVTGSHSILAGWRNHFSQLFNVIGVRDFRQTEIHTAELLVPKPSAFAVERATGELKIHESPGIVQIPAEFIKAWGRTVFPEIHKLINSILNKKELPELLKESIIVPIHKKAIEQIVEIIRT